MASTLFAAKTIENAESHEKRMAVFSELTRYFPDSMVPPRQNLIDLVQI